MNKGSGGSRALGEVQGEIYMKMIVDDASNVALPLTELIEDLTGKTGLSVRFGISNG
jgi:hypothetical protein